MLTVGNSSFHFNGTVGITNFRIALPSLCGCFILEIYLLNLRQVFTMHNGMKKKILISILLYLGAVAHGQVKMGLSGGINLTSVVISNSELGSMGSIPRFGFHAGLGSEVVLKKGFSVIAEAKIIT